MHPDGIAGLCCRQSRPSQTDIVQISSAQITLVIPHRLCQTLGTMLAMPHTIPFKALWPRIAEDMETAGFRCCTVVEAFMISYAQLDSVVVC